MTIKRALGKKDLPVDADPLRRGLLANGYQELPVLSEHTLRVATLPPLHEDPFDRLLLAQAMVEGLFLLTADSRLVRYSHSVMKA